MKVNTGIQDNVGGLKDIRVQINCNFADKFSRTRALINAEAEGLSVQFSCAKKQFFTVSEKVFQIAQNTNKC